MDPNSNEADGISDSEREWVRAVSPSSIGSSVGRPGSSNSVIVGEGVMDGYHRDIQDAMMKGKARARDDEYSRIIEELAPAMRSINELSGVPKAAKKQSRTPAGKSTTTTKTTPQNTPPPPPPPAASAKFIHHTAATVDIPETESLERLIQESITSGVVAIPPPDLPKSSSSQPSYSFLKKKGSSSKSKRLSLWKRFTKHHS